MTSTVAQAEIAALRTQRGDLYAELVEAHVVLSATIVRASRAVPHGDVLNYGKGEAACDLLDRGASLLCESVGVDRLDVIKDTIRIENLEKVAA